MARKAFETYIHLNKKITDPKIIGAIQNLAAEKAKTDKEVCYEMIREAALKHNEKRISNAFQGGLKFNQ